MASSHEAMASSSPGLFARAYFRIKPFIPRRLRLAVRRGHARGIIKQCDGVWPISESAGKPPQGWSGWKDGKQFAVVLTHDVESGVGLERVKALAQLEISLGFRSSFNFIPEGTYEDPVELRSWLEDKNFEVGVHDLNHDGRLYGSRDGFREKAKRINHYLEAWGAVGFRSGFMLRELGWIHDLNVVYDASTFDTDPFEPQPEGSHTIFPFEVKPEEDGAGSGYVELPYTLPQDSTLFLILGEESPEIWKRKLDWIAARGGLALVNIHPDYIDFSGKRTSSSYPSSFLKEFLEYMVRKYKGKYWNPLAKELAVWYRREMISPVCDGPRLDQASPPPPLLSPHPPSPPMIRLRHKVLIHSFRVLDQLILVAAAALIIYFRPEIALRGGTLATTATYRFADTIGMLLLALGWVGIFAYCIRYKADRFVALKTQLKDLLKATSLASFWLAVVCGIFKVRSITTENVFLFFAAVSAAGVVSRLALRMMLMSARRSGYNYRFLLVIGANARASQVVSRIDARPELGYKIVGFVAENEAARDSWAETPGNRGEVLGLLPDLQSVLKRERVDEMIVCLPVDSRFSDIVKVVQHARDLGVVVRLMPDLEDGSLFKSLHLEEFEGEHVVTLFREQMLLQLLAKRAVDTVVSAAALIVLAPLMITVAILIKVTSPGPVFFAQDRVGMNQRRFRIYKFRSMCVDAEAKKKDLAHLNEIADGPAFKMKNDPRITKIGRFIRKTSIDELPQLFNVLHGEMSLVGPRPPLPEEVKKYEWLFRKRLSVKPGITCVWQISGRSNITFERWMEMDNEYIENWSIWLDIKILFKTIPAVLLGRGAA